MRTRPARATDGERLRGLWSATFPQLPPGDPIATAATGEVLVGHDGPVEDGDVVAAALVTPPQDDPTPDDATHDGSQDGLRARRLLVLAVSAPQWDAMHAAAVAHLRAAGVERWYARWCARTPPPSCRA